MLMLNQTWENMDFSDENNFVAIDDQVVVNITKNKISAINSLFYLNLKLHN